MLYIILTVKESKLLPVQASYDRAFQMQSEYEVLWVGETALVQQQSARLQLQRHTIEGNVPYVLEGYAYPAPQ